ncbi:hypothetical protein DSCW_26090 [Desulfosarcina widdelii]|uniref:Uncharacterized protein n=1 Tax=Desulfosarcina widdelii TaxID=947919 RepID=A0A5K7YZQ0_9BACT|nr:hypothetical protein [Desulfosarcina widdelii]BBO75192.1 hypothetical protein DSCW_26090 [Desulfosarcina widdelii]
MSKTQSVTDWMQKKSKLEEKIQLLACQITNAHNQKRLQATAARTRKENYLQRHRGDEFRLSENEKREYAQLVNDYEAKQKDAIVETKKNNNLKKELSDLKLQLAELEFPISVEDFTVDGAEPFVKSAVEPFLKHIQSSLKELDQLKMKRTELDTELSKCKPKEKWMNEKDLINVDINAHTEIVHERERVERKERSISELIERTNAAIKAKEIQLEELRKTFADTLTTAVDAYSANGKKTMAKALDEMIATDNQYYASITAICNNLIVEAGAKAVDVFEYTGGTIPVQTRIFPIGTIRANILNFVESALNP